MKIDCEVIRDLLPLYADDACSEKSRLMVEEHLQECESCSEMLRRIKETKIEDDLQSEKTAVIAYGAKRFKRRSAAVGSAFSGLFMIPILICLIINITTGNSMGSFFIVLASMMVAASLIIVPLMVPEDRAFWTFCTFCASLMLLLGVTCFFTHGSWFPVAASAVLFGLAVLFLPFLIRTRPFRNLIGGSNPVLIVLVIDAVLFVNMINMIRSHGRITMSRILFTVFVVAGIILVITEVLRKRGNENEE